MVAVVLAITALANSVVRHKVSKCSFYSVLQTD